MRENEKRRTGKGRRSFRFSREKFNNNNNNKSLIEKCHRSFALYVYRVVSEKKSVVICITRKNEDDKNECTSQICSFTIHQRHVVNHSSKSTYVHDNREIN